MKQLPVEYTYKTVANANYDTTSSVFKLYANKKAVKNIFVSVSYNDGTGTDKKITYNVGTLTGVTGEANGETVVQYINDGRIYWTSINGLQLKGINTAYTIKAQDRAKELIKDNETVLSDLLLASEFVKRLELKGYNCTEYRNEIKQLYARWENRQNYLIGYSDDASYSEPKLLSNALSDIVNGNAIGLAVSTIVIVSVVVTASVSALAWFVFYTYGSQAKSDCRKSKELNKILSNVDPKTREELYNYIDKYADSFYKKAVRRTKAENLFSNSKILLVAGAAGFLVYKLLNPNKSNEI